MHLTESLREKLFLIEEVINFPTSLISHKNYQWENLTLVPYSNLTGAVHSLVENGRNVTIVTGFFVPGGEPPATETDGPPGALILAEGLNDLGMEVSLLSDQYSLPTLRAGMHALNLSEKKIPITCFPIEYSDQPSINGLDHEERSSPLSTQFVEEFFNGPMGKDLTHLIYIERVGPNHTLESFLAQERNEPPPIEEFNSILPPSIRNRCFNSRLEDITRFTAKTHLLLEFQKRWGISLKSIGIGDRGNEIGAGKIPWEVFKKNSLTPREAVFCCRIKTDYFISCGISNWGGYALLTGVALVLGRLDLLKKITSHRERMVLDYLIHHGPAVDGMTLKQEHSVDGIDFSDYMRLIGRIKEIALE